MSIATKCTCSRSLNGYCQERIEECRNLIKNTTSQVVTINKECLGVIYLLDTLLDFAGEAKESSISITTIDAVKIIKLLKQVSV
jgi:cobyrinic acid a,c-diamide synthase